MRRFLMLLTATAAFVLALGGTALAQQYPPGPTPEPLVPGAPIEGAPGPGEGLAITGSNIMILVWIALAALVVGIALVVASRRRAALRSRGVSEAVA